MDRLGFLFLVLLYIVVSILSFSETIDINVQLVTCSVLIVFIGIPHGSIDQILYLNKSETKPIVFYSLYLLSMLVYLCGWIFIPLLCLIFFLIISAYHFGESQLSKYLTENSTATKLVYFLWGVNILSALLLYNFIEVQSIFESHSDLSSFLLILDEPVLSVITVITTLMLVCLGIYNCRHKFSVLSIEQFFKEVYQLVLIHIAFILLPVLPAFTIYFVVLHSLGVMQDEYRYLQDNLKGMSIFKFIKQMIPFTIISLTGVIGLWALIEFGLLQVSYVLLVIILISIVTLPHAYVMSNFYRKG